MSTCVIPDCHGVGNRARGMCHRCYSREFKRARRGASAYITPGDIRPNRPLSDVAADDIAEFEFLLDARVSQSEALDRIGLCGRSMARRYQHLGRPIPAGLWTTATKKKRVTT